MLVASLALAAALAGSPRDSVPLYDNLGDFHRKVTATSIAQRYFDQGLRLSYAFNHAEAIRAFEEGARRDPRCAMCWFGVALSYGPNVNAPMDTGAVAPAWAALQKAQRAAARHGTRAERALISALAKRYAAAPPADRARLDSAYATAMLAVARRYPADDDAQSLAAEAMMILRPWNYWHRDGSPYPGTGDLVGRLDRVMARNPNHPGACHLYIHAVEAVTPEKAVPCAERLAALMPGAGHLVHMPAHIYIRVGRYADAIEANEHAVHADESYISQERPPQGIYTGAYYPHNYHFMAFAAQLAGRSAKAIEAARIVSERIPLEVAKQVPFAQPIVVFHQLELQTFGRWEELLALPLPRSDLRFAVALAHFTRGMAFAATGRTAEAEAALDTITAVVRELPEDDTRISTRIGALVLSAELAGRAGRTDEALTSLEEARELEDGMLYQEPPFWHQPVRNFLGALLLKAGRPAEAEQRYREDLKRFPNNAWSLAGLAESLKAQGKTAEAAETAAGLKAVGADATLAASRF
jgi:tetratricopeptide (TPR) repeat protein